ncbi:type II secretion system protein [Pantoea sp. LS15]|uniref:type II secretion system protein n=1 Tax=Enterobacterales TaxID=91347 RepID=UPI000E0FA532|nr:MULTISPECIES: type II secretion system protein [Enterobacterales]NJQ21832.1 type II secretion system protein [Pantoea sp. LS15]NKF48428.1 type II secretion system protein [Pantoea sp. LS15]RDK12982.1 type II secretion system protein [Enterobacter sp. 9-2]
MSIIRERGFTLLEIMMVILLLGVVARLAISLLPESSGRSPEEIVTQAARWAAEQSQIEGSIYRMELQPGSWRTFALIRGQDGEKGPLPETSWHPVSGQFAFGNLAGGVLETEGAFPVNLWFLPGGEMTPAELVFQEERGKRHRISISPSSLWSPQ